MSEGRKTDAEYMDILMNARPRYTFGSGIAAGDSNHHMGELDVDELAVGSESPVMDEPQVFHNSTTPTRALNIPSPPLLALNNGGGDAVSGAFFTQYTDPGGDIYLQGGQVSAGTGTDAVANFLLYDASADTWAGTIGQHLLLTITGDGEAADDVLMPVFNMTSVSAPTPTTGIGSNNLPEIGALTGRVCLVSLGVFLDAGFLPATSGNIQVSFCFGGYTVSRF